jgi:hypothetical protein
VALDRDVEVQRLAGRAGEPWNVISEPSNRYTRSPRFCWSTPSQEISSRSA